MRREDQLEFCRRCTLKKTSLKEGLICSLTGAVANFDPVCPNFNEKLGASPMPSVKSANEFGAGKKKGMKIGVGIALLLIVGTSLGYYLLNKEKPARPLSDFQTLGKQMENAFENNSDSLFEMFSITHMRRLSLKGYKSLRSEQVFIESILNKQIRSMLLVLENQPIGGAVYYTGTYLNGKVGHILMAFYSSGAINYFDFRIGEVDGELRIFDVYNYFTGVSVVELAQGGLKTYYGTNPDRLNLLQNANEEGSYAIGLLQNGSAQEAQEIFDNLSNQFPSRLDFKVGQLLSASYQSIDNYQSVVQQLLKEFPQKTRFRAFHNMFIAAQNGDLEVFNKQKEVMAGFTGKTPISNILSGMAYSNAGENEKAVNYYKLAEKDLPNNMDPLLNQTHVLFDMGEIERGLAAFNALVKDFDVSEELMFELGELYPEIQKTEAFQRFFED